jgi:hypothetical protein
LARQKLVFKRNYGDSEEGSPIALSLVTPKVSFYLNPMVRNVASQLKIIEIRSTECLGFDSYGNWHCEVGV